MAIAVVWPRRRRLRRPRTDSVTINPKDSVAKACDRH